MHGLITSRDFEYRQKKSEALTAGVDVHNKWYGYKVSQAGLIKLNLVRSKEFRKGSICVPQFREARWMNITSEVHLDPGTL